MSERALSLPLETPEESVDSSFFITETFSIKEDLMRSVQKIGALSMKFGERCLVEIIPANEDDPLGWVAVSYPSD